MTETLNKMNGQLVLESLVKCKRDVAEQIYRECFPSIRFMITSNSGNIYDAEDIFHDAMTVVIEKARKNSLKLTCSIKTYLYSVCFNMWQNQLDRKSREVAFNENTDFSDDSDDEQRILNDTQYEIFRNNFDKLDPEYQKILNMYLSRYSMKKITSEMGYANEKYAKVKKYLCKEHLKKNIFKDPGFKELSLIASN
jgi:RNA polymerase sigma factor (sigma-70 family)